MSKKKKAELTFRPYPILEQAVEAGARLGYARAFKHNDAPSIESIIDHIVEGVMVEMGQVVDFGDG